MPTLAKLYRSVWVRVGVYVLVGGLDVGCVCVYLFMCGCVLCCVVCVLCSCVHVGRGLGPISTQRDSKRQSLIFLGFDPWGATVYVPGCVPSVARGCKTTGIIITHDKSSVSQARVPGSSSGSAISTITARTVWCRVKRATSLPLFHTWVSPPCWLFCHVGTVVPRSCHRHCGLEAACCARRASQPLSNRSASRVDACPRHLTIRAYSNCLETSHTTLGSARGCSREFAVCPTIGCLMVSGSAPPGQSCMCELPISGCIESRHRVTLISSLVAGGARMRGLATATALRNRS